MLPTAVDAAPLLATVRTANVLAMLLSTAPCVKLSLATQQTATTTELLPEPVLSAHVHVRLAGLESSVVHQSPPPPRPPLQPLQHLSNRK
jgi:hypothetical protein